MTAVTACILCENDAEELAGHGTYHCESPDELGRGNPLGSGDLTDEVGAESDDGDQSSELASAHGSVSDAQGAELGRLEPHVAVVRVLDL